MADSPLKLSDVCEIYRIKLTTLNEWIEASVCKKVKRRVPGRRDKIWVIEPNQIVRLEKFMTFREWFVRRYGTEKPQVNAIVAVLDAIEEGNLSVAIATLEELSSALGAKKEQIDAEIQSLYARLAGDEPIDPNELD